MICFCVGFSLVGCVGNSQGGETSNTEIGNSLDPKSDGSVSGTENGEGSASGEVLDMTGNLRAIITINGKEYGMTITDTTVGRAFAKKLQDEGVYTTTGYRSTDDLCCSESESLETDPAENLPWVCGGVAWTGSWFTVWVSENDAGRNMPVVAQIDEEYSAELQALSGSMEIEVRLTAE